MPTGVALSQPGRRGACMCRVAPGHILREAVRRAVARLLIAALVMPVPLAGAAPRPTPGAFGDTAAPPQPSSCEDSIRSGAYPTASTAQSELWPPNHALVDVGLRVDTGLLCMGRATTRIAVYSTEADDAVSDGSTLHDAQLDPPDLYLRAERQGIGSGRVYLVIATSTDQGASGRACTAVVVSQSQSKRDRDAVRAEAAAAVRTCEATGPPQGYSLLVESALDAANQAPTVSAGADQGIEQGAPAELDGSVTDDGQPAPGTLTIAWSEASGPAAVSFTDASQAKTEARFPAPGTYTLRLTASDGALSSFDEMQVIVRAANAAPVVDAGPDVTLALPVTSATLHGSVTDDGRLLASPTLSWSQLSGPPGVVFGQPASATTSVALPGVGVFELRLSAFDGQLSGSDVVRVTVAPEPPPVVDAEDAAVREGDEGLTGASVEVRLSKPWAEPVSVDYVTQDATAANPCDYRRRFGTLEFTAGETTRSVLVPVVGDHARETDESLELLIGNPVGATLGRDRALVSVADDDGPNRGPAPQLQRGPADGSVGVASPATLAWSASDPDAGDTLTHDVFLGTSVSRGGQQWLTACPGGDDPGPRAGAATGYDEAGDRLIVYGGETPTEPADTDVYVLVNASATGGAPTWERYSPAGGPGPLSHAASGYDPVSNRLVVFGGCRGSCSATSDETWVLANANGLGGTPTWTRLPAGGPSARYAHAATYDPAGNRLFVHGGASGDAGSTLADTWVLDRANGLSGAATWRALAPGGSLPAARRFATLSLDPASGRLVLFGGREADGSALADVHVLVDAAGPAPEWSELRPASGAPAPRFGHTAAFDPATRRLLVYGGTNAGLEEGQNYVFGDAWMLTDADGRGAAPEWVRVDAGPAPLGRFATAAAWSAGANRLLVFGGANNKLAAPPTDYWLLGDAFGQLPLVSAGQTEPSYLASEAQDGQLYFWRVVSRDAHGAWRGTPAWSFSTNHAPVVAAGADQSVALPPGTAALQGSASDDGLPASSGLRYAWSVVSAPGAVAFADPASAATTASFETPGTYTLRLTVDDTQLAADDELVVTVNPAVPPQNHAPVVSAGPDRALRPPESTLALQGTVADDGLPSGTTSQLWSRVTGPGTVHFADAGAVATSVAFDTPGTYVLRLTASDGALTASDETTVFVASASVLPDLLVETVDTGTLVVDPRTLAASGSASVAVANVGPGTAAGPLTLTVFEDKNASGAYEPGADAVLGETVLAGLEAASTRVASVPVSGSVTFAGNLVYAFVDSGQSVAELDETNNYGSSSPACGSPASASGWHVGIEWLWTKPTLDPLSNRVTSPPVVADLDADGVPEVVFISATFGAVAYASQARLRAVSGRDGHELWSVTDPALGLNGNSKLALADLDGDGRPEILAGAESNTNLLAFEHDGSFKWRSDTLADQVAWGGPSIADLDADGVPEIVIGRQVLTNQGHVRWTGVGPGRGGDHGAGSIVVDLDQDGRPELVAGNTAYVGQGPTQGQLLWRLTSAGGVSIQDGYAAAGNFDDDPNPEIALVSRGWVVMLEHDGRVKWGPFHTDPTLHDLWAGPPTIADFDGDGKLEVAVAGQRWLVVYAHDGTEKWRAPIEDTTTASGSVAFDFDGDGAAELVYGDHNELRIYRGTDGVILFHDRTGSGTGSDAPVVADVDGDGEAEVVAVTDNWWGGAVPGLRVYGEGTGAWAAARPLWNQFAYTGSNVDDDLRVPRQEQRNLALGLRWMQPGAGRNGTLSPSCAFPRPDLTASALRITETAAEWSLSARIGNGGARVVGPDVPVSLYDGDPRLGAPKLGTLATTRYLHPGEYEDVTLRLPRTTTTRAAVFVSADDAGGLHGRIVESDEQNNVQDGEQALSSVAAQPDLVVVDVDAAGLATDARSLAATGIARARVRNQSTVPVGGPFEVAFFEDRDGDGTLGAADAVLGRVTLAGLAPLETRAVEASVSGSLQFLGSPLRAFVDAGLAVAESDETNNVGRAGAACQVRPAGPPYSLREEWGWATAGVPATPAVSDLDGDGIADVVFVAMGSGSTTTDGQLRALRGRTGQPLVSSVDPSNELNPSASPAIGDIDGDGRPEIVVVAEQGQQLLAFEHDGAFKWRSATLETPVGAGAPFLVDLDGDGRQEIVVGRQVLNGNGTLRWTGAGPFLGRSVVTGLRSVAADLDGDGRPEVIAGASAYRADGTLLWSVPSVGDGVVAIANLDGDPYPEIVVANGSLWLLGHDGSVRWGPLTLPGSANLGTVTIADFDGDTDPEIGVGRWPNYVVVEAYGQVKWSKAVAAPTLVSPVASAFDFDDDGAAELVLADTTGLHVLKGLDGSLLGELPVGSCSAAHAYPAVADADGDGKAEIVLASLPCSSSPALGVHVLGESHDGWVRARPLWNQYDYVVPGERSWRANVPAAGASAFAAADLTTSFARRSENGSDVVLSLRIGNAGVGTAAAGVPVSAYNGDPRLGAAFVASTATTRPLSPGEYEDVLLRLPSALEAQGSVYVVADDAGTGSGTIAECDEENNRHDTGVFLNEPPSVEAGPDRSVSMPDPSVALSAQAHDDGLPLGSALGVHWFYAGPLDPSLVPQLFADPSSLATTATFPAPGLYHLGIEVSDSRLATRDFLDVTVYPANAAPAVDAGPDQSLSLPTTSVSLQGSVQDDGLPAGSSTTSTWSVVSAPGPATFASALSPVTTAQLSTTGTYVLRLTASDGSLQAADEVTVRLDPANAAPVVDAGPDQRVLSLATTLAGTVSDDGKPSAGTLLSGWSVVSAPAAVSFASPESPSTAVTFAAAGAYVLRLTASDGARSASDDVEIIANPGNEAPRVNAGADGSVSAAILALAGRVSDDGLPASGTLASQWSLASGPGPVSFADAASPTTTVRFEADGVFTLRLTATDGELTASDEVAFTVARVNQAPVVEAGSNQTVTLPIRSVALSGSASDDGLPSASALSYRWTAASGPGTVTFTNSHSATTAASFDAPGSYVLQLEVSDGALAGSDSVAVVVNPGAVSGAPPSVSIASPAGGARLSQPTDVVGSVASADLLGWKLEQRLRGEGAWTTFAAGASAVSNAALGQLDPSLLVNGIYEVRLTATDNAGRSAQATTIVVVRDNLKVGNFSVAFVDLEVPVAGQPIRVTRTYDSRDTRKGDFGYGWRLDVSNVRVQTAATLGLAWYGTVSASAFATYCLQPTAPPVVTLTFPDGRVQEFEVRVAVSGSAHSSLPASCQAFAPIDGVRVSFAPVGPTLGTLELVGSPDVEVIGSWPGPMQLFNSGYSLFNPALYKYTAPDGQVFVVDRTTGLKSLTDRAGNVLTMTPAGISSSHPQVPGSALGVVFERDGEGRITRITDPLGKSLVYSYDANGDLASVTDRESHSTRFGYLEEPAHHLETIDDPLGRRPIRNEYDPGGRLVAHVDAFGKRIEYAHDLLGRQEVVTDRTGAQRVLEYDERGNVLRETDPQGRVVVRTFDLRNNRLTETEPYDPAQPPSPIPTTRYAYDGQDNLLSTTDALGHATSYTYNATRQVLTTKDARDKTTSNTYDPKGNLLTTTDALGNLTTYSYDARGNVLTQTATVGGIAQVTRYEYDAYGRLQRETDATGHATSYTYDLSGNRLTQTTSRTVVSCTAASPPVCSASGTETLTTTFGYDSNGRLVSTTDPDGSLVRTVYDALGRQLESYDKLDRKTTYEYDEMGRLARTTYPDNTFDGHGYDAEGRRVSSTDRGGHTTAYQYDGLGRLEKTTYADTSFTSNSYDAAGRLVVNRDARGKATTYEYDAAGRRLAVVDPLSHRTSFTYDANGNQETVTDARGHTTRYEYDALNRRTKTVLPSADGVLPCDRDHRPATTSSDAGLRRPTRRAEPPTSSTTRSDA